MRIAIEIEEQNDAFQYEGKVYFPMIEKMIKIVAIQIGSGNLEGSINDENGNAAVRYWVASEEDNGQQ